MDFYTQKSGEKEIMTGNLGEYIFEGVNVRSRVDEYGNAWFVAKDVCDILEYEKPSYATRLLDDEERGLSLIHI